MNEESRPPEQRKATGIRALRTGLEVPQFQKNMVLKQDLVIGTGYLATGVKRVEPNFIVSARVFSEHHVWLIVTS